jgi:hypothetical protein
MQENNQKTLSPENIDIIVEIVKKYNLGPVELFSPEMSKILSKAKSPEERVEIIKNLPFKKILERVKEILRGEIKIDDLGPLLEKDLKISRFLSEKIAREIREKVFLEKEEILQKTEEETIPLKRDIYREPIE